MREQRDKLSGLPETKAFPEDDERPSVHVTEGRFRFSRWLSMTETEWEEITDLDQMLRVARRITRMRKLRLLACACCRHVWAKLRDKRSRRAVEVSERYADGLASEKELQWVRHPALNASVAELSPHRPVPILNARGVCVGWNSVGPLEFYATAEAAYYSAAEAAYYSTGSRITELTLVPELVSRPQNDSQYSRITKLVRHILGNPFHRCPDSPQWPEIVVQLAYALYRGDDCGFALHDALLDAGLVEFADHFKSEAGHPKGCWAVDLILGKK